MESLSHRKRLLRCLRHEPVDRVPDYEFGAWPQTLVRWQSEGMDIELPSPVPYDGPLERYFDVDGSEFELGLPVNVGLCPPIEEEVLEDRDTHVIIRDADGAICEQLKPEHGASIPRYLCYMIEGRRDWERLRDERLDPHDPARLPADLGALGRRMLEAGYPIVVECGSLFGWIRNWMGIERLSILLYDDPALIEEIVEHLTQIALATHASLSDALPCVDLGFWWEDMCYNHGPLISPREFGRLWVPRYRRITAQLAEMRCAHHILDCDGNIHALVPLWLEAGINVMFPVEAAHTDAERLAADHGPRLAMRGGFDKRALIAGPEAIDAEFSRLEPLIRRGGFIPHTDHRVPPDVSFAHYLHYRRRKCEIIGKKWVEPGSRG